MEESNLPLYGRGEPTPKGAKNVPSAWKVMATAFLNAKNISSVDYPENGRIINSEYSANLLDHLKQNIMEEWSRLVKKKVLFYQDNARL